MWGVRTQNNFYHLDGSVLIPRADNFTPPERTPWGGREIVPRFKRHLGINVDHIVGESWEVSGHPSFPNRFGNTSILTLGNQDSDSLFGQGRTTMPYLVKLLNSGNQNLSVQVHPKLGETKHEAWIILDAQPGSGIYLGLKEGVERGEFLKAMQEKRDLSLFLNFIPVKAGDAFYVPTGTLHAIGSGILLLEPQEPSETTYRAYDWGSERELHPLQVMQNTRWDGLRGAALIDSLRRPSTRVECPSFVTEKAEQVSETTTEHGIVSGVVIDGTARIETEKGCYNLEYGQAFLVPAIAKRFKLTTTGTTYITRCL